MRPTSKNIGSAKSGGSSSGVELFQNIIGNVGVGKNVLHVIVFIKHRANIERLIAGTEGKIGSKG